MFPLNFTKFIRTTIDDCFWIYSATVYTEERLKVTWSKNEDPTNTFQKTLTKISVFMPSHYRSARATNSKYFSKSWDFTKMISHRVVWWLFSLMKFNDPKILKCLEISLTSEITWSHYNNGNYHISSVINASRSPYK